MFGLEDDDASGREKCYTTVAQLPQFIDPKQPPTKKSPFSTILSHPLVHTVEVTLPKKAYSSIESSLNSKLQKLRYARISMNLSSLIDEGFFNTYIKKGNVLMLSEGRSGLDNVFTLVDGVLKLELNKEIYEGTGLTGNPIRYGGKKHGKERFLVELNLRLPSMLHGTESLGVAKDDTTLKGNNPEIIPCEPVYKTKENITTPSFSDIQFTNETPESELKDLCVEVSEWLGMVSLQSRRVSADDDIDPYLCRYDTPDIGDASASDLITLKWHGFIPPKWIIHLFTTLFRETGPRVCKTPAWFSLSAGALGRGAVEGRDGYTIMVLPAAAPEDKDAKAQDARHFICWEYVGAPII